MTIQEALQFIQYLLGEAVVPLKQYHKAVEAMTVISKALEQANEQRNNNSN